MPGGFLFPQRPKRKETIIMKRTIDLDQIRVVQANNYKGNPRVYLEIMDTRILYTEPHLLPPVRSPKTNVDRKPWTPRPSLTCSGACSAASSLSFSWITIRDFWTVNRWAYGTPVPIGRSTTPSPGSMKPRCLNHPVRPHCRGTRTRRAHMRRLGPRVGHV